ncbi:Peptidase S8, subtilisin-related [Trema orientale]|uniref:Peptidase S8, subtilisin-related n=1 Tax=Trema orientale TaxID=63057 RepID=A0A2P5FYI9_TREOI|nr:Peptidase S8, subtilisin-related [Trema orientale]
MSIALYTYYKSIQNVVSVLSNKGRKLHTTRSWDFLRLERNGVIPSHSIWNKARYGEDTIIGNLDVRFHVISASFISDKVMLNLTCIP